MLPRCACARVCACACARSFRRMPLALTFASLRCLLQFASQIETGKSRLVFFEKNLNTAKRSVAVRLFPDGEGLSEGQAFPLPGSAKKMRWCRVRACPCEVFPDGAGASLHGPWQWSVTAMEPRSWVRSQLYPVAACAFGCAVCRGLAVLH